MKYTNMDARRRAELIALKYLRELISSESAELDDLNKRMDASDEKHDSASLDQLEEYVESLRVGGDRMSGGEGE